MPRKIYDIKPPKVAKKTEKDLKEFLNKKKPKVTRKKRATSVSPSPGPSLIPAPEIKNRAWWPVPVGVLTILLIVGVYLFFKLPKADVEIWPKVDVLSFTQTITADKSVDVINLEDSVIPAKYFETTKINSQDFPATGNASNEGKAGGSITIYNKTDPVKSLTFRAGTRFLSDSGKLFMTYQKVVIPAGTKSGSKVTPGSVKINVEAAEGGSDYNIAPSNFSVPGLKGTSYYYSVYATSSVAMSGGYSTDLKKVTSDDIQSAKDVLTQKTKNEAMSELRSQISDDYIILDNTVFSEVTNASTETKAGAVIEDFNYQVSAKASTLAFKKSDVDDFAKKYILSQVDKGRALVRDPEITYSAGLVDVSEGKATLHLDLSSKAYQSIEKNTVELSLLGKNEGQIAQTINDALGEEVSRVEVKLWPFWVKNAPKSQKALNLQIKFE